MTTIPIISSEIPPELDGNHIVPEEARFAAFENAQRDAIRRFCEAINPKAMELDRTLHIDNWEVLKLSALDLLEDEILKEPEE